ncbi:MULTISPECIES: isochorismatase family protein [unclassified Acinetobacter]|uniref:isochorismatase family protein n=1 Tax=unclassified Acinetobacter TaxID=196816 RepID=UPI0035B73A00
MLSTNLTSISGKHRILTTQTQALLIDVQQRLMPHIAENEVLLKKLQTLLQGLQALNVPIMCNQQYTKALGETLPELVEILTQNNHGNALDLTVFEKRSFSCCDTDHSMQHIAAQQRPVVLLFGIETHVCVLQTAMDLLDHGYQPVLVVDAVSSRSLQDKQIAVQRMQQAGVILTTVESILFELCRDSQVAEFKTISNLVK